MRKGNYIVLILGLLETVYCMHKTLKDPKDLLIKYRSKRHFDNSPEPSSGMRHIARKEPLFVVQKHAASHLHYDFRLEIDGVLKSWAVPKGPSVYSVDKRLAVPTEDHPLEYAYFEGVIPPGNYGAGIVMVWDIGEYSLLKREPDRIEVWLTGTKLKGGYALIKMQKRGQWLLVKMRDKYANISLESADYSALSGRTMQEIEQAFYSTHKQN